MVASVEETESSVSSTSLGRHSADLPIVGPPRGLLARVFSGGKSFSGFLGGNIHHGSGGGALTSRDGFLYSASAVSLRVITAISHKEKSQIIIY